MPEVVDGQQAVVYMYAGTDRQVFDLKPRPR
jgi:hypothetical protein